MGLVNRRPCAASGRVCLTAYGLLVCWLVLSCLILKQEWAAVDDGVPMQRLPLVQTDLRLARLVTLSALASTGLDKENEIAIDREELAESEGEMESHSTSTHGSTASSLDPTGSSSSSSSSSSASAAASSSVKPSPAPVPTTPAATTTSAAPAPPSTSHATSTTRLSAGAIAGIVVGCVVGVAAVAVALTLLCLYGVCCGCCAGCRRAPDSGDSSDSDSDSPSEEGTSAASEAAATLRSFAGKTGGSGSLHGEAAQADGSSDSSSEEPITTTAHTATDTLSELESAFSEAEADSSMADGDESSAAVVPSFAFSVASPRSPDSDSALDRSGATTMGDADSVALSEDVTASLFSPQRSALTEASVEGLYQGDDEKRLRAVASIRYHQSQGMSEDESVLLHLYHHKGTADPAFGTFIDAEDTVDSE